MDVYGFDAIDVGRLSKVVRESEASFHSRTPPIGFQPTQFQDGLIPFVNATGTTIPAWGVVRITAPTTVDGESVVNVAKVNATYQWRYLVNGSEDVASGASGYGSYLFQSGRVLKDTATTPTVGERWGPKNDSFMLWQHRPGFLVDGRYDTVLGILGAIQLPPGEVRVKNDDGGGSLAAGASRTFGIYGGAAGTADTGLEVTLTNGSTTAWATDKYGFATADAGGLIFGSPQQV